MTFLLYSHTASYGATKSLQAKGGLNEPPNHYGCKKFMKNYIQLGKEGKNKQNIREAEQWTDMTVMTPPVRSSMSTVHTV